MTYNKYVQEEALKQTCRQSITVYKVRKPEPNEEVVGYETSDCINKPTETEIANTEGEQYAD